MLHAWRRAGDVARRILAIVVLFCVLRLAVGLAMIAFIDDEARAWGARATIILALAFGICLIAGLAVRRWAPPRRSLS